MALDIDQKVSDFMRDAQWRVAEIGVELDNMESKRTPEYKHLEFVRQELYLFMNQVYRGRHPIKDGYTYIYHNWSDIEVAKEIEYLRSWSGMNITPYYNFVSYYPHIKAQITGESNGTGLPGGSPGDFYVVNNNFAVEAYPFPGFAGMIDTESAANYFNTTSNFRVKYIKHPAFTATSLSILNPSVKKGELVVELDDTNFEVIGFKIGDGQTSYNSLPYLDDIYKYVDLVTVDIGDWEVDDSLYGKTTQDILKGIVSPYVVPVISNVRNNAGGSYANDKILLVGQSISTPITIAYDLSNSENVSGSNPVTVDTGGYFTTAVNYPLGTITLTPVSTINPTTPLKITIKVTITHDQGGTVVGETYINFVPRIKWGASTLADLTSNTDVNNLTNGGFLDDDDFEGDYDITTSGYLYVLIPNMLIGAGDEILFGDVVNPNVPQHIDMTNLGSISHNNGTGTYNLTKYRSTFNINDPRTIIRVTKR